MTTTTVRETIPKVSTRETRALELYRTRGHEIERIAPDVYLVPSCSGERRYTVRYGGALESCDCPDHAYHPELSCKHLLATGIHHAKRRGGSFARPCACLGGLVFVGHLVEDPDTGDVVEVVEAVPCCRCRTA